MKRVVQHILTGAHAGLRQILGTTDELATELQPSPLLPAYIDGVDLMDHRGTVVLVAVTDRYVMYREKVA